MRLRILSGATLVLLLAIAGEVVTPASANCKGLRQTAAELKAFSEASLQLSDSLACNFIPPRGPNLLVTILDFSVNYLACAYVEAAGVFLSKLGALGDIRAAQCKDLAEVLAKFADFQNTAPEVVADSSLDALLPPGSGVGSPRKAVFESLDYDCDRSCTDQCNEIIGPSCLTDTCGPDCSSEVQARCDANAGSKNVCNDLLESVLPQVSSKKLKERLAAACRKTARVYADSCENRADPSNGCLLAIDIDQQIFDTCTEACGAFQSSESCHEVEECDLSTLEAFDGPCSCSGYAECEPGSPAAQGSYRIFQAGPGCSNPVPPCLIIGGESPVSITCGSCTYFVVCLAGSSSGKGTYAVSFVDAERSCSWNTYCGGSC